MMVEEFSLGFECEFGCLLVILVSYLCKDWLDFWDDVLLIDLGFGLLVVIENFDVVW